jgi:hypothetical protein
VRRDELALRDRDLVDAARDRAVEAPERAQVGAPVLVQRGLDLVDRDDRVARVLPPVRVVALQLHGVAERDHPRVRAGPVDRLVHPGVHIAAGAQDEVGVGDRRDVVRAQLVLVRVGVRGEDLDDVHARPADVAREVRDLCRRGDDREPAVRARVAVTAAGGGEHEHEREPGEPSHRRRILLKVILIFTQFALPSAHGDALDRPRAP